MTKQIARSSLFIVVMLFLMLLMPGQVHAARSPQSITVNIATTPMPAWGGLNVTVAVNTSGRDDNWRSTSYRYDSVMTSWTCANHNNNNSDGNHTETFEILVPPAAGSYNLEMRAHSNDSCSRGTAAFPSTVPVTVAENNPALAEACGVDVTLILDESGSIWGVGSATDIRTTVRNGVIELWDALESTNSTLDIVEFNTTARVPFGTRTPVVPANKPVFLTYINATGGQPRYEPADYTGSANYTNWDDAFEKAAAVAPPADGKTELVIFFTDGVPTTNDYNYDPNPFNNLDTSETARHVGPAAIGANLVKAEGSHIFGIGISNPSDPGPNLGRAIGPNLFPTIEPDIAKADFTITAGFGDDLRDIILKLCQNSVTVTKETWDGTDWAPASGWDYTAAVAPSTPVPPFGWILPSVSTSSTNFGTTAGAEGALTFQWKPADPHIPSFITISEGLQDPYEYVGVDCVDHEDKPVDSTGWDPLIVELSVDTGEFYKCVFKNTEVLLEIDKSAPETTYAPGDQFTYTIVYGNKATADGFTSTVNDPEVTDQLHADLKYISSTAPTGGSCDATGGDGNGYGKLVTCTGMPALAEGHGGSITITVEVQKSNYDANRAVPNTACVDATTGRGTPLAQECDVWDITTPVTISYFEAEATSGGTSFEWETATETGNAGFNIYVETPDGLQKANDELILSQVVDSLSPQRYSFEAAGVSGETFYITDVSLQDEGRMHGPFTVGEKHGERSELEKIDWASVHIENDALTTQRAAVNRAFVNGQTLQVSPPSAIDSTLTSAGSSIDKIFQPEMTAAEAVVYPMVDLKVKADGIYRVTYEDVAAVVGSSLNGAPVTQLALTNKGKVVPIYVSGRGGFGRGDYFDFYGEGLDTLYTDSNIYVLQVHDGLAQRVAIDSTRPARTAQPAEFYMETVEVENNVRYSYRSSNGDPWYDKVLYTKSGMNFDRSVTIDNYVAAAPSTLAVEIWGVSNRIDGDDHHVQVAFNGAPAIDSLFDFNEVMDATAEVAAADVKNGGNTLTFNFPNDQGADYDMAALEGYSLSYPRAFVARDGQLDFEASDDLFSVDGLDSRRVVVYRLGGDEMTRVGRIKVRKVGSDYTAKFNGSGANDTYFVSTVAALPAPEMTLAGPMPDINSGSAELLIISHPNFISGLQPLVALRQSEGLSVKVVDVQQIYKQYNGGIFDPYAIQDYIEHAMARMGTRYVLLVGGDTRDYRNYTGSDSISFVPTLYAKTSELIHVAPVDPLFTDVTGDGVPDAAVGRFPVHTVAELTAVVDKTLTYHARTDRTSAIFAADTGFEEDSDSLIPTDWSVEKTYISEGFDEARANLLEQMNAGVPLANFIGHSDTFFWSFDRLFEAKDAVALTNHGKPMVVTQWGCFNTYFVGEAYQTMGDSLMLAGSNGAAAVTGATTITKASSEQKLGELMMPRLMAPGARIGDAMQDAKAELNKKHPKMVDVLLGWTILGDPTLVVTPDVR